MVLLKTFQKFERKNVPIFLEFFKGFSTKANEVEQMAGVQDLQKNSKKKNFSFSFSIPKLYVSFLCLF